MSSAVGGELAIVGVTGQVLKFDINGRLRM